MSKSEDETDMKKKLSVKRIILLCVAVIFLILAIWTVWGNTALTVSNLTVSSSRIPSEFSGFRIAQVSDLHNAEFGENNIELLTMLSESEPDIIVITGDLVDSRRTNIDVAVNFVKEAVKIAPVYYVTGNHESRISQYGELKSGLEKSGAVVLEDKAIQLENNGKKIMLIGLSDPDFTLKNDVFGEVPAMVNTKLKYLIGNEKGYTVLLSHRPELFEEYANCNINLVFSGHAHGGQFRLPFVGGLFAPDQGLFPKYDAGLYTQSNTNMVVSRGIGNSIMPLRFNNRPEIVVVELSGE